MSEHRARRDRRVAGWVAALLLAASATYVAATFQWREALALTAHTDPAWFFLGGGGAIVAYWLVRAIRWRLVMGGMQARTAWVDLYLCSSVALSLSVFTPLQSGELLKVELLRKYGGLARAPGYSAFLLERVADLYMVLALGAFALAASTPMRTAIVLAVLTALPLAAYAALHKARLPGRPGSVVAHLQDGVRTPSALAALLLSTAASWAIVAFGWHASLRSVSISLDLAQLLGLVSLVTLATLASFIPGGLGVAEVGTAELLVRYGFEPPLAQAGALALRGFSLLVIALGVAHLVALRARHRGTRAGGTR